MLRDKGPVSKRLYEAFKKLVRWFKVNITNRRTAITFAVVWVTLATPTWLGYSLGVLLHNPWFIGVATAYTAFWCGPFTPYLPLCLAITLGVLKAFDKIRAHYAKSHPGYIYIKERYPAKGVSISKIHKHRYNRCKSHDDYHHRPTCMTDTTTDTTTDTMTGGDKDDR